MKITSAKDIKNPSALRILYANPGIGKTSTIKYMPGKKLVIDLDGTSSVLKGLPNIDIVQINDPENIKEELPKLLKEIKETTDYDSIALDNISEMDSAILNEYGQKGKNNGIPSLKNYQQLQFYDLNMLRYLKTFKKQVLVTAWELTDDYVDESTGQSFTRSYPQVREPILQNIMGLAMQVGRLIVSPKDKKRYVMLSPTNSVFAKNQIDHREFCLQEDLFKDAEPKTVSKKAS